MHIALLWSAAFRLIVCYRHCDPLDRKSEYAKLLVEPIAKNNCKLNMKLT